MMARSRRAVSLVEILVVAALIVGLSAWLFPKYLAGGKATSNKGLSPVQRSRQAAGVSYVVQIRQAIAMYRMDHDEQYPPSLDALRTYGVTKEMTVDPVSGSPLSYDPATGMVSGTSTPDAVRGDGSSNP
ncbi:MAG: type II secretion system protein [Armatimonadota bacterium]